MRQVSRKALELIQEFEVKKLKSYQGAADKTGTFTVGYGHVITGHEIATHGIELFKAGQTIRDVVITDEVAQLLFEKDVEIAAKGVTMRIPTDVVLTDDQFGAIVSLTFNIGIGGLNQSKILENIRQGNVAKAVAGFKSWIRSNGEVRNGLIRRRAAEAALYKGEYPVMSRMLQNSDAKTIREAKTYLGLEL